MGYICFLYKLILQTGRGGRAVLECVPNSSRRSLEDPGLNPAWVVYMVPIAVNNY